MKQQPHKTRAKHTPFVQGTFDVTKNTLPRNAFTVGGIVYPKSQFAEVLEYWFGDEPLPPSKWRPENAFGYESVS